MEQTSKLTLREFDDKARNCRKHELRIGSENDEDGVIFSANLDRSDVVAITAYLQALQTYGAVEIIESDDLESFHENLKLEGTAEECGLDTDEDGECALAQPKPLTVEAAIKDIEHLLGVQTTEDDYMTGLYNGLELARATILNVDPTFVGCPDAKEATTEGPDDLPLKDDDTFVMSEPARMFQDGTWILGHVQEGEDSPMVIMQAREDKIFDLMGDYLTPNRDVTLVKEYFNSNFKKIETTPIHKLLDRMVIITHEKMDKIDVLEKELRKVEDENKKLTNAIVNKFLGE